VLLTKTGKIAGHGLRLLARRREYRRMRLRGDVKNEFKHYKCGGPVNTWGLDPWVLPDGSRVKPAMNAVGRFKNDLKPL
jgi:hypothetical protein